MPNKSIVSWKTGLSFSILMLSVITFDFFGNVKWIAASTTFLILVCFIFLFREIGKHYELRR